MNSNMQINMVFSECLNRCSSHFNHSLFFKMKRNRFLKAESIGVNSVLYDFIASLHFQYRMSFVRACTGPNRLKKVGKADFVGWMLGMFQIF